jgi:sugar/nucleoside kinase (ribokinase family)
MIVLLGQVSFDYYSGIGKIIPGGGILHNAYHLTTLGFSPLLITRIGFNKREVFQEFIKKNHIHVYEDNLIIRGDSASIKVRIDQGKENLLYDFKPGIWSNFSLTDNEKSILKKAKKLHVVLVEEVQQEFRESFLELKSKETLVTSDFLDLRYHTEETLEKDFKLVDIAFIGWKYERNQEKIQWIKEISDKTNTIVVLTLGKDGALVVRNGEETYYKAKKVKQRQIKNTNGCGDAFISYFLAEYYTSKDISLSVNRGLIGGKSATNWEYALPEQAYPEITKR